MAKNKSTGASSNYCDVSLCRMKDDRLRRGKRPLTTDKCLKPKCRRPEKWHVDRIEAVRHPLVLYSARATDSKRTRKRKDHGVIRWPNPTPNGSSCLFVQAGALEQGAMRGCWYPADYECDMWAAIPGQNDRTVS